MVDISLNKLQPNLNAYPEGNNISSNDLCIYFERALQDSYNIFLFETFQCEVEIFKKSMEIIKEDEDVKLIGQKDNIFQAIKHWFEHAMKAIKGLFAKFIAKVKEKQNIIREKFNSKTVKKFQDACDIINLDKSINFTPVKSYRPEITEAIIKSNSTILGVFGDIGTSLKIQTSETNDIEKLKEKFDIDDICETKLGVNYSELVKVSKAKNLSFLVAITKRMTGSNLQRIINNSKDNDTYMNFNINDIIENEKLIINVAFNKNDWLGELNKKYNQCKKIVTDAKKTAEYNIKCFKKDQDKVNFTKMYISVCDKIIRAISQFAANSVLTLQGIQVSYLYLIHNVLGQVYKGEQIKNDIIDNMTSSS